ncbi:TetR/AcrR family transcriptional regulator [Amycolatopsis taiwanensis]|uniref:TetR family transcriptional regulator n=1 Tax=Amycolatopsis taiwanensis TaxID=342230 RepID=A0A9W6R872_9PSEU|nr:TetR/AcrR family transcriptional regulator [Amycolatopsis taiwanensis]GLY69235.1 TetR family transcriptional regulator [Amycolatopsis taiwanensis]
MTLTEQRVRAAAVKLFADKGFHGTGIRELAQAAKISSASLYHYMGTKEELLEGIMCECLDRLLAAARQVPASDPRDRLAGLVALHVLTHAIEPAQTRVVDHEVHVLSPEARSEVVRRRDEYERLWAETIEEGIAAGVFHDTRPTLTRLALLEMCNGVSRWYSPHGPLSLEELATHFARLAIRMLGGEENDFSATVGHARSVVSTVWKRTL